MIHPGRGLHGQAVEELGRRIVRGDYPPGSVVDPANFEAELGVSKTVVREAMRVLASKGLLESRQKRGTTIRPRADWNLLDSDLLRWQGSSAPTDGFLEDLAEVRAIVEPAGARLAALRRTPEDLDALREALDAMAAAGADAAAMVEADLAFHRALLDAAHNELLSRMEVVIEAGLRVRDRIVHGAQHFSDSIPVHQDLLDAVEAGDPDAAAAAVDSLLAQATDDLAAVRARTDHDPATDPSPKELP
ncbi:FadR/GntR family transcriptional regulator [Streptomyces sp. ME02-8801-2C]|uniref:FadR/GntR family transcriptional regulator n=1 Tax=Streptomyces sp. ME02-8801-2C TaxID=3028680 RepID=UPI0029BCDF56|nr:FadR/GntR family transcriptional regulator [Streptomyces sp. ME02-8801-2C]MDX3457877.1 FadR/GntR family transcriptional regulator [Streptomyces sp. ME02-8801-2C]